MDNMIEMIIQMKNLKEMYGTEEINYPYYLLFFKLKEKPIRRLF